MTVFTGRICRPGFLPGLRKCPEVASGPRASGLRDGPLHVFSDRLRRSPSDRSW